MEKFFFFKKWDFHISILKNEIYLAFCCFNLDDYILQLMEI